MKKNRLSMNLIMVLAMAAVAVCVLVCAIVIFVQTYRSALLRNAETTSRQGHRAGAAARWRNIWRI